jgi:hypothetical protein
VPVISDSPFSATVTPTVSPSKRISPTVTPVSGLTCDRTRTTNRPSGRLSIPKVPSSPAVTVDPPTSTSALAPGVPSAL